MWEIRLIDFNWQDTGMGQGFDYERVQRLRLKAVSWPRWQKSPKVWNMYCFSHNVNPNLISDDVRLWYVVLDWWELWLNNSLNAVEQDIFFYSSLLWNLFALYFLSLSLNICMSHFVYGFIHYIFSLLFWVVLFIFIFQSLHTHLFE